MNTEEKNNYVQYVNRNGIVKAKNVVFEDDGTTTRFTVDGIDEEFFIFAIYQNNIQRFCVGIDNLENTDMLGFINSNMVDLSSIPPYAFLQSQTVVQFSYNNEYVQNYKLGAVSSGGGGSSLPTDSDDLKYLKSLMSSLYPTHKFTYIPYDVFFLNGISYANDQPNCLGVDNKTCYFMSLFPNGYLTLDNEMSVFKTRDGSYPSLNISADLKTGFPILFTGWYLSGATEIFGKGYKIVSDLPFWTV